jgi:hypothetical protein
MNSKFVISLDFELLWGVFDVIDYRSKKQYFRQTKDVIPQILDLFQEYDIHATWATVGMLFNQNWEEWESNIPEVLPNYKKLELSAYNFGKALKSASTEEFCFAPNLIQKIAQTPGQELATHTYSHYYCLEEGQTAESFEKDIENAVAIASNMDIELKSLVFPRNQIAPEYLSICNKRGIENVRSNPRSWYWKDATSSSILDKFGRTGDAYFDLGKKSYPSNHLYRIQDEPLEQKASRFFRPVEGNKNLRKLKLNRILSEMEWAAKNDEVYHLWWHPHNFGNLPEESMNDLKIILNRFQQMKSKYNFQSLNMVELGGLYS